jgi:hypothetical protein
VGQFAANQTLFPPSTPLTPHSYHRPFPNKRLIRSIPKRHDAICTVRDASRHKACEAYFSSAASDVVFLLHSDFSCTAALLEFNMRLFARKNDAVPPASSTEDVVPSKLEDGPIHRHSPTSIDPMVEARVRRKLDKHLIPLLSALYLLAFLDRSNIGNARIAGMEKDLDLSSDEYTWLLTIFYISYIVFAPLAIMWKVVPPHVWAAFCVLGWGLLSTVQAATHNWAGMMALRFLMGVFEIAYGPGVPYLLSFFYLRHELGLRAGMFLSAAPLANTFAGALAYGITSGHPGLAKWRVLFLVEGLPTVCMAVVAWFFLPDSPEKAKFLTEEEKDVARRRGVLQVGADTKRVGGIDWKEIGEGLKDVKSWILGVSTSDSLSWKAN